MYQSDPAAFIAKAGRHVKPGGLISLVEKGYYGAEARAIRRRDFTNLRKLRTTRRSINLIGQEVWAFVPEELEHMLIDAQSEVLAWHGIRLVTDDMTTEVTMLSPRVLSKILEVEAAHGSNPHIRGQGQMLHFIARKK